MIKYPDSNTLNISDYYKKNNKLEYVVASCNNNPAYFHFIPHQIEVWKKFGVTFICVFVNDTIPDYLLPYKSNIYLWNKCLHLNNVFLAQNLRIFIPALLKTSNYVMITDMDMLPCNIEYYTDFLKDENLNNFMYLREVDHKSKEVYMCYNTARPDVWSKIFNVSNEEDIVKILEEKSPKHNNIILPGDKDWFKDQYYLYEKLVDNRDYEKHGIKFIELRKAIRRLEPTYLYNFDVNFKEYDDAHFHRGKYNPDRLVKFILYIRAL